MPNTTPSFSNKPQIFRKIMVEEFIREFNFLADVLAGRATAKADFTDKILKVLTAGIAGGVNAISAPGVGIIGTSIEIGIGWMNDYRKENKLANIKERQAEVDQEQLRILLETVALEASRRYEFIIGRLSDIPTEAIIPFAKAGVERMLEYIAHYRLPLTFDNLLNGLMAGHSGAYVSGFRNTRLKSKDATRKVIYTAEGIYGRSAFMTPTGQYWILRNKAQAKHKRAMATSPTTTLWEKIGYKKEALYNYGYVKFDKQHPNDPKYGYVSVLQKVVDYYFEQFKEAQVITALSPSLMQELKNYSPSIQIVTKADIEAYLKEGKKVAFTTYLKKKYPQLMVAFYAPNNEQDFDLTKLNFENANFSDCILNGIKLAGSLANSHFENSYLQGADLTGVTSAKGAHFNGAHLEFVKAGAADLSYADFTHAQLHYGDFAGATLSYIQALGAIWVGANLSHIKTESQQSVAAFQEAQQQQQKALENQQRQLRALQKEVEKHQQSLNHQQDLIGQLEIRLEGLVSQPSVEAKEQAKKLQSLLGDLQQEKTTREAFTRYCQTELKGLHHQAETADRHLGIHQQLIEQLQKQLQQTQESHSKLPQLIAGFDMTIKQLEEQKSAHHQLANVVNELEHHVEHYIQEQNQKIEQVYNGLLSLQQEMEQFKQEVRAELQQQRDRQQKAFHAMDARLQAMEAKLEQQQIRPIPTEERQVLFAQQIASMLVQLNALQFNQPAPKPSIDPQHTIAYYQLYFKQKLAEGSFGKIYLGRWCEQDVAIKTLEGQLLPVEEKEFIREVSIMSRLHHPNITQFYGACLEDGRACLVMEYMAKGSLCDVLEKTTLTAEQQKQIALDVARGLYYLHSKKVYHRDLKSPNILMDETGRAKLSDFGLSKINYSSIQTLQKEVSDIRWQAPETLQRRGSYNEKSDIYSYGMVLWEIFTGQRPYANLSNEAVITAIKKGVKEKIPADMPDVIANIIRACCHSDPSCRPDLVDVIRDLERYQPRPPSPSAEVYYEQGITFEKQKQYAEAYQQYERSSAKGFVRATTNLGNFFLKGIVGVAAQDKPKAAKYFLNAANKGHQRAMYNLAQMLEYGDGIDKDLAQALHWYKELLALGDKEAQKKVDKLTPLVEQQSGPNYRGFANSR